MCEKGTFFANPVTSFMLNVFVLVSTTVESQLSETLGVVHKSESPYL